jgi:mannose-6-phosphate isomerase-like protein (cupin superfamily)
MAFTTDSFQSIIEKPWGKEIILTPTDLERVGKILCVSVGKRLSLQYHQTKEETLSLFSGSAELLIEDASGKLINLPMELQRGYTIAAGQKHRITATSDCVIFEVSSPEHGSTIRVEDDYNRPNETEELRKENNRGWPNG